MGLQIARPASGLLPGHTTCTTARRDALVPDISNSVPHRRRCATAGGRRPGARTVVSQPARAGHQHFLLLGHRCRATEYRIEADHYEALIGGTWHVVPPDKILQRTDNPTGHAVVCWTPQRGILCFVRATES